MPREAEYKPLLYTTTIRNPERYKDFMNVLKEFDGEILNDNTVKAVEIKLFQLGLYRPLRIPDTVKAKWESTQRGEFSEEALTVEEASCVYDLNDPNLHLEIKGHKEAGFPKGWPSRFDTQFKLMKVLGFVYYEWNEPIRFSQTGMFLAETVNIVVSDNIINRSIINPANEQLSFMQAFAKQQRCNPFIRELNDNIPLILLLKVIKKLNADPAFNGCGISYKEIPLLIFWKDNDAEALYRRIKRLRQQYRYNPSNEVIEEICVNEILGGFKEFKLKSIINEYPDEFVRKMRMTGLISFRGGGRFIDINHNEDKKIDYILEHYSDYIKYTTEKDYFEYMSNIDSNLLSQESIILTKNEAAQKLASLIDFYTWDIIKGELTHLSKKSPSKHDVLKFIPAPARLEFLTALAIKKQLPDTIVIPNYPCDDEGLPTSTAGGNQGDIECLEKFNGILVEVTMAEGRQQTMMEVWPISRHYDDFINKHKLCQDNVQSIFVAPSIFRDTIDQVSWVKDRKNQIINTFSIPEFITFMDTCSSLMIN